MEFTVCICWVTLKVPAKKISLFWVRLILRVSESLHMDIYSVEDLETQMILRYKIICGGKICSHEVLVSKGATAVTG